MSFHVDRYINDTRVAAGAEIVEIISTERIFGSTVKAGGRCETLDPEAWVPIITVDGSIVWTGPRAATFESARGLAVTHARERLRTAARAIFADPQ
jgi:hypothetical protein